MRFHDRYFARLWVCVGDARYGGSAPSARGPCGLRGRLARALTGRALIDAVAVLPSFVLLVITYAKCKASGGSVPWHGTACYVVAEDGTTTEQATAQSVRLAEATGVSLILKGFRVLRIFKAERYTRHVSIIRDGPSKPKT